MTVGQMPFFRQLETPLLLGFVLFGIAITWLTTFSVSNIPEKIEEGMVLRRDIRADKKISIVNEEEMRRNREEAAASVLPVFDFDETAAPEAPRNVGKILIQPIVESAESLSPHKKSGIVLLRIHPPEKTPAEEKERVVKDLTTVLTVAKAKPLLPASWKNRVNVNTTFNLKETEARKDSAIRSVKEKTITYQPGDFILRAGTNLEPQHVLFLEAVKKARGLENRLLRFLGTFLFVTLALGATFYFSERFVKRFLPSRKDYLLMGLITIVLLFILRISLVMAGVLQEAFFPDIPRTALYYAIPIAGGVMLARMVLTAEVSLVLAVVLSLLAGLTVGSDVNYTTYCLISCIAAGSSIVRADHRSAIIKAGMRTGFFNAIAVLGVQVIQISTTASPFLWSSLFGHLLSAFAGGLLASVFVFLAAPVIETLLDYTTDIKLLELANLNHPLLRELIVRAPGTYHHSHIVGVLAEAGAEAIGANSLLAKVSAYYHDIGKMKKPDYYVENDPNAQRRHENLSPHMSALIVSSHVKEGIALAQAHRLPKKIIDMIPEHHGTKQIGVFYQKALDHAEPGAAPVDEKDFRYPGPKPQSREAGVLMLADSNEAAVRALKEKTPQRIKQTVEQIIDRSFAEAQLDECDLTLKDLHGIAEAFTRILTALYHARVEYATDPTDQSASLQKSAEELAAKTGAENVHRLKFPQGG